MRRYCSRTSVPAILGMRENLNYSVRDMKKPNRHFPVRAKSFLLGQKDKGNYNKNLGNLGHLSSLGLNSYQESLNTKSSINLKKKQSLSRKSSHPINSGSDATKPSFLRHNSSIKLTDRLKRDRPLSSIGFGRSNSMKKDLNPSTYTRTPNFIDQLDKKTPTSIFSTYKLPGDNNYTPHHRDSIHDKSHQFSNGSNSKDSSLGNKNKTLGKISRALSLGTDLNNLDSSRMSHNQKDKDSKDKTRIHRASRKIPNIIRRSSQSFNTRRSITRKASFKKETLDKRLSKEYALKQEDKFTFKSENFLNREQQQVDKPQQVGNHQNHNLHNVNNDFDNTSADFTDSLCNSSHLKSDDVKQQISKSKDGESNRLEISAAETSKIDSGNTAQTNTAQNLPKESNSSNKLKSLKILNTKSITNSIKKSVKKVFNNDENSYWV